MPWKDFKHAVASRRYFLIKRLGGKCRKCGSRVALQFHHIWGRTWIAKKKNRMQRVRLYEQEAMEGEIELLCEVCNKDIGKP